MAGVPEWEYSMFLYITFPFFGFHWRGFPCNLPLNFLEYDLSDSLRRIPGLSIFGPGVLVFPILRCFSCIVVVFL